MTTQKENNSVPIMFSKQRLIYQISEERVQDYVEVSSRLRTRVGRYKIIDLYTCSFIDLVSPKGGTQDLMLQGRCSTN
jgi:hypothetical protein